MLMNNPDRTIQPEIKPIGDVTLVHPEKRTLSNGMQVYLFDGLGEPVFKLECIVHVGSVISDNVVTMPLMMAMLTEGTLHCSSSELNNRLDYFGSYVQHECEWDHSSITLYGLTAHAGKTIPLIREMLFSSAFPQHELDVLCANSRERLQISLNKVNTLSRRLLNRQLFAQHAYGRLSEPDHYVSVHRDAIAELAAEVLTPANISIIASGQLPADLVAILEAEFGQHDPGKKSENPKVPVDSVAPGNYFHHKDDAIQTGLSLGVNGISRSMPDFHDLQFLNVAFGGYFGSRLMSNIREDKGYTYGIGSGVRIFAQSGTFGIHTEVGSAYAPDTLVQIDHEMKRLQDEPMDTDELELVRNYITGNFVQNADGPFAMAERFSTLLLNGLDYSYYTRYLNRISSIQTEDVQKAAQKFLNYGAFAVCAAGPEKPF
jgi:predicted Zn-dependent peptidase